MILIAENELESLEREQYQLAINPMSGPAVWPAEMAQYHRLAQTGALLQAWAARDRARPCRRCRVDGRPLDLGAFHHEVLGHGSLPLPMLRREILGWVDAAVART